MWCGTCWSTPGALVLSPQRTTTVAKVEFQDPKWALHMTHHWGQKRQSTTEHPYLLISIFISSRFCIKHNHAPFLLLSFFCFISLSCHPFHCFGLMSFSHLSPVLSLLPSHYSVKPSSNLSHSFLIFLFLLFSFPSTFIHQSSNPIIPLPSHPFLISLLFHPL